MGLINRLLGRWSASNPRIRMSKLEREVWNAHEATLNQYKEALKASRVTSRAYRDGLTTYIDLEEGGLVEAETTKDKNISPLDAVGFAEEMFKGVPMNPTLKRGVLGYMKGHPEVIERIAGNLEGKFGGVIDTVTGDKKKEGAITT